MEKKHHLKLHALAYLKHIRISKILQHFLFEGKYNTDMRVEVVWWFYDGFEYLSVVVCTTCIQLFQIFLSKNLFYEMKLL